MTELEVKEQLDKCMDYNMTIMCLKDELVELKGTEFESQIKSDIEHHTEFVMGVRSNINKIRQSKIRNVMRMRYISSMSFKDISTKLGITYQWTYKLHLRGLEVLAKIMD